MPFERAPPDDAAIDVTGRISLAAMALGSDGFLLAEDVPAVMQRDSAHFEWATK